MWHAVVTMFSFMLGGFDTDIFYDTKDPDPIISVAFFVLYEAVMAIMLLNLLIAIMTDSYSKVRRISTAKNANKCCIGDGRRASVESLQ